MAITRVQFKNNTADFASSVAATFDSNVTSGNLIVAILTAQGSDSTVGSAACNDTLTNSYSTATSVVNATSEAATTASQHVFYAISGSGGSNTVTISGLSEAYVALTILEYSGMAAASVLDQANKFRYNYADHSFVATSTYASGDVTTTQADALLIGAVNTLQASDVTTPDSGWSEVTLAASGGPHSGMVLERIVASTGTYNNSGAFTGSQNIYSATIAAFKAGDASVSWLPVTHVVQGPTNFFTPAGMTPPDKV
jgi:hypothetical protein